MVEDKVVVVPVSVLSFRLINLGFMVYFCFLISIGLDCDLCVV